MCTGFGPNVCTMMPVSGEGRSLAFFGLSGLRGNDDVDSSPSLDRSEYFRLKFMSIRKTILWHAG